MLLTPGVLQIRQMIVEKFVLRAKIASKMSGTIIPAVTKSIKGHEVLICGARTAEVIVNRFRYTINLGQKNMYL
jgi:hypothetical protein